MRNILQEEKETLYFGQLSPKGWRMQVSRDQLAPVVTMGAALMESLWVCMLQAGFLASAKNIVGSTPDTSWQHSLQVMHVKASA